MKSPNEISVLYFGDIVGRVGRRTLAKVLPLLKDRYQADLVLANCENATHGRGCSHEHYEELVKAGVDIMTSGNHFFDVKAVFNENLEWPKLVRPINLAPCSPLEGTKVFRVGPYTVRVTNAMGSVEVPGAWEHPCQALDRVIKEDRCDFHIVDLHAEATGEKACVGRYLDGRISLFVGTHTHVQTNDARILPKGTCFITDLGMCGLDESCLGAEPESAVEKTLTGRPIPFDYPEKGKGRVDGIHAILGLGHKGVLIEPIRAYAEV